MLSALAKLGPLAAPAVPELVALLRGAAPDLADRVVGVLAAIGPAAEAAVPALSDYGRGGLAREERAAAALAKINRRSD